MTRNNVLIPEKKKVNDLSKETSSRDSTQGPGSKLSPEKRHERLLTIEYYKLLNQARNLADHEDITVENWLSKWEAHLVKCHKAKLEIVQDYKDSINTSGAIHNFDEEFGNARTQLVCEKMDKKEEVDVFEIIDRYRSWRDMLRRYEEDKRTWKQMSEAHKKEVPGQNVLGKQGEERSKESGRKGKTCICGGYHGIDKCYYVHPEKKPKSYVLKQSIKTDLSNTLKHDEKARQRKNQSKIRVKKAAEAIEAEKAEKAKNNSEESPLEITGPVWVSFARYFRSESNTNEEEEQDDINDTLTHPNNQPPIQYIPFQPLLSSERLSRLHKSRQNLWLLSTATNIHITNTLHNFTYQKRASSNDKLQTVMSPINIQAWGTSIIETTLPTGKKHYLRLLNVAYVPEWGFNAISVSKAKKAGFLWRNDRGELSHEGKVHAKVFDFLSGFVVAETYRVF